MPPKRKNTASENNNKDTDNVKRQKGEASYTLYITNLNTHIKPKKMKENLYVLFTAFADVLHINYPIKNHRGQSWISVSSSDNAIDCVEKLNGFKIFDHEITVKVARKDSKLIETLSKEETD